MALGAAGGVVAEECGTGGSAAVAGAVVGAAGFGAGGGVLEQRLGSTGSVAVARLSKWSTARRWRMQQAMMGLAAGLGGEDAAAVLVHQFLVPAASRSAAPRAYLHLRLRRARGIQSPVRELRHRTRSRRRRTAWVEARTCLAGGVFGRDEV